MSLINLNLMRLKSCMSARSCCRQKTTEDYPRPNSWLLYEMHWKKKKWKHFMFHNIAAAYKQEHPVAETKTLTQ